MKKSILAIPVLFLTLSSSIAAAQSVSFALKSSPNVSLVFDSIDKYRQGIILPSFLTLRVESIGTEWDLYVGTTTASAGVFDVIDSYGTSGTSDIPVGVLQARVYNASNTSQTSTSFFNLTDISNPTYLIGSASNDIAVPCPAPGTNTAGSFSSQPQCYTFKVDLKANPGFNYKAGSYSLRVDFVLVQDL